MEGTSSIEPLNDAMPQRAIGLVDELDDPSPGHMSDHPTAISSVTTVVSRPFLETLGSRFVRGSEDQTAMEREREMVVDDVDDKENKG
jgi:serine/threonine-protein phosphatase 4 regulatory subunit 2